MATHLFSKEKFIEYIQENVLDSQVIVFTQNMHGNLTWSKKTGLKLPFQFSEEVFKGEGVGHVYMGKSIPVGLLITNYTELSEKAKDVYDNEYRKDSSHT